jgi:hypothetical protein
VGHAPYAAGGGISATDVTVSYSSVSGNHALADGDAETAGAHGGGIETLALTLANSTVANNTEGSWGTGAGILVYQSATITDSTIAGNSQDAESSGGGAYLEGSATILRSTIAGNTYDGIRTVGELTLQNSVVANNAGKDVNGTIATSGYNLIGKSGGGSDYVPSDLLDVDPLLGPLQNNGGPTQTMAILPGSPAIDSGTNQMAPAWDQRGPGYPRVVNGTIDRGAFEVQNTTGPAAGRSVLVTAPRSAPATLGVPLPASVEAHRQPPATIPVAAPTAVGKPAAPIRHAGHLSAIVPDLALEAIYCDWR